SHLWTVSESDLSKSRLEETEAILDSQPSATFAIDGAYRIVRLNRAALQLTGMERYKEAIGQSCYRLIHDRDSICPFCPLDNEWKVAATPERTSDEDRPIDSPSEEKIIHRPSDQGERTLKLDFIQGQTVRVRLVEIVEDITAQREQQEESLRMENLASLGTMISGIAHELNNPLTGMGLTLQNLEANLTTMDSREVLHRLQILQKDLRQAARIVSDILGLARPGNLRRNRADLLRVVQRAKANTVRLYPVLSRQIRWVIRSPDETMIFYFNPEKIERMLVNLFRNSLQAYDYSPGEIRVDMRRSQRYVHIIIEDDAGGIPDDQIRRIFVPFYTRSADGRGTGLGLSISLGIVREHNGRLRVRTIGKSTRFLVSLPFRKTEVDG
ncbi:MAG: PAS domain-containing sensor histidine kinase, partial [Leptospiraceae bacterium]|nr:PAS domain-containing sensor histidine kinase [Leptospiraceae bacterium]